MHAYACLSKLPKGRMTGLISSQEEAAGKGRGVCHVEQHFGVGCYKMQPGKDAIPCTEHQLGSSSS